MEQCEGWDSLALLSKWALSPLFPQIIPRGCMPGAEGSVGRSRICTSCPSWSVMAGSLPWAAPTPSPSKSVGVTWTGRCCPATQKPTSWTPGWAPGRWSPSLPASSFSWVRDLPGHPWEGPFNQMPSLDIRVFPKLYVLYTVGASWDKKRSGVCLLVYFRVWRGEQVTKQALEQSWGNFVLSKLLASPDR